MENTAMVDNTWTKLENKPSLMQNGTQYRNMQAWSRPCALCRKEFVAYTPGNSPADKPPTVTTCEEHRGAPAGINYGWLAWDGQNIIPGRRMKAGSGGVPSQELAEVTRERDEAWDQNMKLMTERGELVRNYQTVFEENSVLKAKLAQYELQPAMAETAKKMPWT